MSAQAIQISRVLQIFLVLRLEMCPVTNDVGSIHQINGDKAASLCLSCISNELDKYVRVGMVSIMSASQN